MGPEFVPRAAALAVLVCAPTVRAEDGVPLAPPAPRFEPADARLLAGEADLGRFFPRGLAVGPDGCPVIVGQAWSRTLPLRRPLQVRWTDGIGPFVMKLDPTGSRILFASSLGGSAGDAARACAVGPDGDIYVLGIANPDSPTTRGAMRESPSSADRQSFLCRIDPDEGRFVYRTFIPPELGSGSLSSALAVGPDGSAFVAARTLPSEIGLAPEPADHDAVGRSIFVPYAARISPDGSTLMWAKGLAPAPSGTSPLSIAVSREGDAIVAGWTTDSKFPRVRSSNEPGRQGPYFSDCFVVRFDSEGRVLHSGLLGITRWGCSHARVTVDAEGTSWTLGYGHPVPPPEHRGGREPAADDRKHGWIGVQARGRGGEPVARGELRSDRGHVLLGCAEVVGDAIWALGRSTAPDLPEERPDTHPHPRSLDFLALLRSGSAVDTFALGVVLGGDPLLAVAPGGDVFVAGGLDRSGHPERPNAAVLLRIAASGSPEAANPSGDDDDRFLLRRLPGWRPGRWWEKKPLRDAAGTPREGAVPGAVRRPVSEGPAEPAEGGTGRARDEDRAPEGETVGAAGLAPRKGRLDDRRGAGRDRFRFEARVAGEDAEAALAAYDPSTEMLRLRLGDAFYPFLVEIAAGDPGWKERGATLVWESPAETPFRARIAIRREDGRLEVEVRGFDFPGPQRNPIQVVLESRDLRGAHAAPWTLRGEGRLVYP